MPDSSEFRAVTGGKLRRVKAAGLRAVTAADLKEIYESPDNQDRGDESKRPEKES